MVFEDRETKLMDTSLRIASLFFRDFTLFLEFLLPQVYFWDWAQTLLSLCHSSTQANLSLSTCRDCWGGTIPTLHLHWARAGDERGGGSHHSDTEYKIPTNWAVWLHDQLLLQGFEQQVVLNAQFSADHLDPTVSSQDFLRNRRLNLRGSWCLN